MLRSRLPVFAVLMVFGCRSEADRQDRPNLPASGASPATAPQAVLPGSVFADLERAVAPVQVTWDAMVLSLRADSGTAREDSDFERFQGVLGNDLQAVDHVVRDHDLVDLFHLTWMRKSMQTAFLKSHGIPNDTVAGAIVDSIYRFLKTRSIKTRDGEGGPSFSVSDEALSKSVGRYLSPAAREYLELSLVDQSRPGSDDGYLLIPWNEFGDRLAVTDHFVSTYPASPFAAGLHASQANGLRLYLQGAEPLDAPGPELTAQAKANIAYFLAKYGSTPAGAVVRGYRDALAAQGYRGGKTLLEYFAKTP